MSGYHAETAVNEKKWEVAWYFVNKWAGNKSQSYAEYYRNHEKPIPKGLNMSAYRFFKDEEVQNLIEQFRKENREKYSELRDDNIALLRDISTDDSAKKSDRVAAIKELNHIMGYGTQNVNVNGQIDNEIEINITGI